MMAQADLLSCPQDASFGPGSTCRALDFTLRFEQTILSFGPDTLFIILAVTRIWVLKKESRKLERPGWLFDCKVMALAAILGANACSLALTVRIRNFVPIWIAAPVVQLVAVVPLCVLIVAEHFNSDTPSGLIICYGIIKGLLASATLRTYVQMGLFHSSSTRSAAEAWAAAVGSYFLLGCVELVEKRRLLRVKTLPVVSTSSFISRSFYLWLLPLLWTGRNKTLTIDDCGEIPLDLRAYSTRARLQGALDHTKKTASYLFVASAKTFGIQFLSPVFPRIVLLLSTFAQPILVNKLIGFVVAPALPDSQGWALVGAFVVVYAMMALSNSLYWEKVFDTTVQYRGALVGTIYSKALRMSSSSSRSLGGGIATTYMSVDVERVCQGAHMIHEMWASVLAVPISVALVYQQATWPAFLPIGVTLLLLAFAAINGSRVGSTQAAWLACTDRRIKFLSSVIHNVLPIKWSGYENALAARTHELRNAETKAGKKFYYQFMLTVAVANTAGTLCMLSVLGPYAALASLHGHGPLDPNRLFTIVTAVSLLTIPLNYLGQVLPVLAASYASLKRIQDFLLLDEKPPTNSSPDEDVLSEKGDARPSDYLQQNGSKFVFPIRMQGCSFTWTPNTEPFLRDINISLERPCLYMCIGPVAAGKTLFLASILGETTCTRGSFRAPTTPIAYASQDALIIPGTIRENIVFGLPFDDNRYSRVLDACALTSDIQTLKLRDGTLLGEKGTRLSGGQKQRVALARAVYANAPWTLLDDPLSALDAETEEHVFQSLFGPRGLLRDSAVILVTHSLKHLGTADRLLVFDGGHLNYDGNLQEIVSKGYNPQVQLGSEKTREPDDAEAPEPQRNQEHIEEQEVEEAAIAKSSRGKTPYLFFARMSTWSNTTLSIVLLAFAASVGLGAQFYLKLWSERNGSRVGAWTGGYAAFTAAILLTDLFAMWFFGVVVTDYAGRSIHACETKGLFSAAPSYFMSTPAGRIINRFSQDIFTVDFEFPIAFLTVLFVGVSLVGTFVFTFLPAPWLTISVVPLSLVYFITLKFYLATSTQLQHLEASSKSPLYTLFSTTVAGLETIRALHIQSHFLQQNDAKLDRSQKPYYFRFSGMRFLFTILSGIQLFLAVGLAIATVALRRSTNAALLGLGLSSITSLSASMTSLLSGVAQLENASVGISRIHEIASLPPEETRSIAKEPDSDAIYEEAWPADGSLEFKDVTLRYKPELDQALQGVSFKVKPGTKIGICGRSGSGKSSLILALYRSLDQSLIGGDIVIDGVNTREIFLALLRQSLSLVAQDPFLWHASLRDNLDPEQVLTDDQLWSALRKVDMSEAISALPEKLETIIEDGGSVSKGQRQLLCLARVLLRRRKIIVLDEASSSLDLKTDERMRRVIASEFNGCSIISVAHRIATIVDFDQILVLDDGKVVEHGSPRELLGMRNSRFARLAASQGINST